MLHRILKSHWAQMNPAVLNSAPLSPRVRAGIHACRLQTHPLIKPFLMHMLLAMMMIERCFCGSLFTNSVHFYYTGFFFAFHSILLLCFDRGLAVGKRVRFMGRLVACVQGWAGCPPRWRRPMRLYPQESAHAFLRPRPPVQRELLF